MSDLIAPVKMLRWDTGTLTWVVWDGSLTTGALVIGAVTQSGTWTVQPGNTANTTAWKVDGSAVTQPVNGPLTDAQLRANPVAVVAGPTQIIKLTSDLTPSAPTSASVGVASAQVVAANAPRKGLSLRNLSTSGQRISLGFGATAVLDSGVTLYPLDTFEMADYDFDLGAVNAIASAASASLGIQEWTA